MSMTQRGIIGAGNWLVDQIHNLDRWPGEGNLCNILSQGDMAGGGGPCNVLLDLAKMAHGTIPLYAVGRVGNDARGEFLMKAAKDAGLDVTGMEIDQEVPTSYTLVMAADGKRTFFHCRGCNAKFSLEQIQRIQSPAKIFYLGYLLLLDDLDKADPEYGTRGARALCAMREKGYYTVLDLVSERPEVFHNAIVAAMKGTDALVINEVEAGSAFGVNLRKADGSIDKEAISAVAPRFFELGLHQLLVIHYPEGSYARLSDGREFWGASFKVDKIVGSVGAGDAFCAGIVYSLHENYDIETALKIGAASAAFNLGSSTATDGAVSIETIKEFISK